MKRKIKGIVSLALASLFAAGTATALTAFAETGTGNASAVSPADLWEKTSGFQIEANVEAPDTMKYGAVNSDGSTVWVDENSKDDYLEDWETNGVKITSTSPNKKLYYSNILNVDALSASDHMLVISPLATIQGAADFTAMDITLEDADDPSNYLVIEMDVNPWWAQGTRLRMGTADISPIAYIWGQPQGEISGGGSEMCYVSFNGTTQDGAVSKEFLSKNYRHRAIKLNYDAATKMFSFSSGQGGATYPVADMDDGHLVGYGNEWGGFKSNRVRLSITMKSFNGTEASVMIFNVFGQKMNGTKVEDTASPVLKFEEAANEIPKAEVGKAYSLYDYTCDDVVFGKQDCEISVTDPDGVKTAVTASSFTPNKAGYYTLTYTAQDNAGNTTEKLFKILAQTGLPTIEMQMQEDNFHRSVGEEIKLPKATLIGGAGALSYTVSVSRVGGTETVAIKNGAFTPMLAGEYLATYETVDYVGNKGTKTLVYTVVGREKPLLMPIQQLVRLFDNVPVDVPMPTAYDFSSVVGSKLNAAVEVTAKNADGSYSETIENGIFNPSKEKFGESVTFTYKVACNGGVGQVEEFSYTVAIQDVPKSVSGYFKYDESAFDLSYNEGGKSSFIKFQTVENITGTQSITFVNPLGAEGFEIAFAIPAQATNFDTVTLKLRDSMNAAIGFDMQIRKMTTGADTKTRLYLRSGGVDYAMNGTFNTMNGEEEVASKTPLRLQYVNGEIRDYTNKAVFSPKVNFDGEVFNGFPSKKAYLEIELAGIHGTAGITLAELCNQTLGKRYTLIEDAETETSWYEEEEFSDTIRPQIRLDQDVPDEFKLGQEVEIPYARAFDVLSAHVDVLVSLRTPQGKYIYKDELAKEGMSFTLDSYGVYFLNFLAVDAAGRRQTASYTISAKDTVDPTIVLKCADTLEMKVGNTLHLSEWKNKAIVQDNLDSEPTLTIMVISPDEYIVALREFLGGEAVAVLSYTFEKAGTYIVRFYVADATYNATWKDVTIVVK